MKDQSTPTRAGFKQNTAHNLNVKLGLLLGLLLTALFAFPAAVNPRESIVLVGVIALLGPALAVLIHAERGAAARAWRSGACSLPVCAGWALAGWAWVRWMAMDLHFAGREYVLGWLAFGAALTLGVGVGALQHSHGTQDDALKGKETSFVILRRMIALAAIGFGLYAAYQHFIGLPSLLVAYRAEHPGPPADVYTQSMLYMLEQGRPGGRLGPTNLFAAQLALMAVFCIACLRTGETRLWRLVGVLGLAATAWGIILTRSRGGMLTFTLTLGIASWMLLCGRGAGKPRARQATLALLMIGMLQAAQAMAQAVSWTERLTNISTIRERLYYWGIAANIWERNPLIGAGPGSFEYFYLHYKPDLAREAQHAHSWLLELGCSLGLLGVLFALAMIAGVLWRMWELRHGGRGEASWLALAAGVLAVNGLFEFTLDWPEFRIAAGFLIGAFCALSAPPAADSVGDSPGLKSPTRLPLLAAAALTLGVLWMGVGGALATAQRQRGDDARLEGDAALGLEAFRAGERFAPGDPLWPLAQAEMLSRLGRSAEAWPLLQRAAKFDPYSASIPVQQAEWLIAQGHKAEARPYLDRAVENYGSNIAHRLSRAELLLSLGDRAAAQQDRNWIITHPYLMDAYLQPRLDALNRALGASDPGLQ